MGNEWSGKRDLIPTTAELPTELGDNEEQICQFCDEVVRAVIDGGIDPRRADNLEKWARVKLNALRQLNQRDQILELERILAEAKELHGDGLILEESDRQHKTEPLPGRWERVEENVFRLKPIDAEE